MAKDEEKIDFRYNFGMYWGLVKKYRVLIAGLLFSILLLQATYVSDKFLFKIIIDKGTAFVNNELARPEYAHTLLIIGIAFAGIVALQAVLKWFHIHMVNHLDAGLIFDLKKKLFNHIIGLSYNFHTTHKTGSLISRLVRGGSAIERMTDVFLFNAIPLLFSLVLVSGSLALFDWVPALVVFLTVVLFIGYSLFIQVKQQSSKLEYNDTEDFEKANISDFFTNIDSIKYFGKEKAIKERYSDLGANTKKSGLKYWDFYRWLDSGQGLILGVGLILMVYFPLIGFLNNEISIGTLVFIYTVYGTLMGPLFGFVHGMRGFYQAMGDFESLFQYARIENEIKDRPGASPIIVSKGEIEFSSLEFAYHRKKILSSFSLKIPAGKKVAFVGHSGTGKSTIVRLLYRLYDVQNGRITIDGIDISEVKQESLRESLSIVPQECILFDDTIYNNIAFSNPKATKEQVMAAMKFAQLDKAVSGFPNQENTIVGERGVRLSGGEKQRVSIARAILADKKILVLDEATSSLDSETEHEIQKDLQRLMQGRTSIIIAHRLSTIMHADMIVVMEDGNILQTGTHQELISQEGRYKELWNLQKGGYIG